MYVYIVYFSHVINYGDIIQHFHIILVCKAYHFSRLCLYLRTMLMLKIENFSHLYVHEDEGLFNAEYGSEARRGMEYFNHQDTETNSTVNS